MQNPKEAIEQIQALTYGAYQASGQVAALIGASRPENMADALEQTAARMEQGAVQLRALCESCLPPVPAVGQKPALSPLDAAGKVEVNEFGWLHIQLNTLLPHCRFAPPLWLTDTISRLLDRHERRHGKLPLLEQALLVIDEYCDVDSRQVYDADNKGWKAVSNAIKGRAGGRRRSVQPEPVPALPTLTGSGVPYLCAAHGGRGGFLFYALGPFPLFPLTFGYIRAVNPGMTSGYILPAKPPAIGYIGGTILRLTIGYIRTPL